MRSARCGDAFTRHFSVQVARRCVSVHAPGGVIQWLKTRKNVTSCHAESGKSVISASINRTRAA